ncbi:amino acid adenylation domain-containing protein [Streptomyces sp. NPDC006385]|uniref:amino acid adenylation domain-containing protein n=1 Tax=Streptomyces sp. NPDC006385 TaxID=3156761 RepID=UPI0033BB3985
MDDKRALLLKLLASVRQAAVPGNEAEGIAVIGLAGRYPGAATPQDLWRNVLQGRNCIGEVPADRWAVDEHYHPDGADGRSYSKWGGWLQDVDKFDPLLFQISPSDAEEMDPQERLFLETAWATAEDAGYAPRGLAEAGPVGVFAGVMNNDYEWLAGQADAFGTRTNARAPHWSISNRVSYVLDLRGPSLTVDTACSASLTAIHLACDSLRRGECQMALAGGVNLILHPAHLDMLADRQMISRGDRCRSFGASADGFVDGEGVGAVLLKPLRAAEADGDRIYAVLKGSAINSGGRTSGYTVPSPQAQAEVIRAAVRRSGVDPRTITYVEAHGTGTPLGDPIEIAGLREGLLGGAPADARPECAIGSVKSNIGHLESAAGIAGLAKVLMQLRHGVVPPSLHSEQLNPDIDLSGTPFRVQQEAAPWPRPVLRDDAGREREFPRRAGISSFGGGGANAHLIVEEYLGARPPGRKGGGTELVVLSALSEERLRTYAGQLADFLDGRPAGGASLQDSARTAAEVLRARPEDLDPDTPLADYGFSPAQLAELSEELGLEPTVPGTATLRDLASGGEPELALADVAHTLRVGREQLDVRLAFPAGDLAEMRAVLRAVARQAETGVELNDAGATRRTLEPDAGERLARALADGDLRTAARLWTQGAYAAWPVTGARRVGLPTYPFARKRYWLPLPDATRAAGVTQPRPPHAAAPAPARAQHTAAVGASTARTGAIETAEVAGAAGTEERQLRCLQPVWCPEDLDRAGPVGRAEGPVAVLTAGEPDALAEALLRHHPGARLIRLDRDDPAVLLAEPVAHLYHLGATRSPGDLETGVRDGVLALFATHAAASRLTVVTEGAHEDNPSAAALLGFVQVLAAERPDLDITCVDVQDADPERALAAILAEPAHPAGRATLLRNGRRYVRRLVDSPLPRPDRSPYRQGGTYLLLGGTGGIGRVLSEDLARRFRANLVWISRSEPGPEQKRSIARVREAGGEVLHLTADAADAGALRAAVAKAKEHFGALHGAFHAAMTFNASTIAELGTAALRTALAAKVDGSVALAEALDGEPLDFLVFFSSVGSFVSAAGNAAYVAASAFQDAYGRQLATRRPHPVHVVNWGYWGQVGSGAQPGLTEVFRRADIDAFPVREGLDALERILAHGPVQVLPIRAGRRALQALGHRPSELARRLGRPEPAGPGAAAVLRGYDRLAALCDRALLDVYRRMGALLRPGERHDVSALADRLGILPKYRRLHRALLNILADAGQVSVRGDEVEVLPAAAGSDPDDWERELDEIAADHPDIAATVTLTRLFLRCYPQVLRGEVGATEVMFPDASMDLVRDFYRGNPLTDSFNELVAHAVAEYARPRLSGPDHGEPLRVVELGAGTGATTERVLPVLSGAPRRVEYVFTDISPQFLEAAEQRFADTYPFTVFRTLNLERPLADQGFAPGTADVVVATNVVHATSDLRRTLRTARELLRPGGRLVLNELTAVRSSITVTGGVLEGWWAFTDAGLRIPDAPLATAATWQRLVLEEGCTDAVVLERDLPLGQHVIVAQNADRADTGKAAPAVPATGRPAPATVPAGGALLARLAQIVEHSLKLEASLDTDRPLSDYGFDSLSGMKVAAAIEETLGVRVPLRDLLRHPTLRDLADFLEPAAAADAAPQPLARPAAPGADALTAREFPLSAGQRALAVIERTSPGTYAYNLPLAFWLEPDTDLTALSAALQALADRHEQLRARVIGDRQRIEPALPVPFTHRRLDTDDVAALREEARLLAREPFDLEAGPLVRAAVLTLADGRHVLLLVFHHIVFDGVSIAVFLRELSAFYRGAPPTERPERTYADFVAWQQQLPASPRGERLRSYWLRRLEGDRPELRFPWDRPRPAVPSHRGASVEGRLSGSLVRQAKRLADAEGTSLFCVLLASYTALLHRYCGQDRVDVGTPVAGRPSPEYADVIGYFVNMVVLRCDIAPEEDFRGLLRSVRDVTLEALEHGDHPLLTLAQDLRAQRLFDTAFYFQNWVETGSGTAPVTGVFPGVHQEGEFDLTLEVVEEADGARYCLKYNPDLLDEDTARRFGEHFEALAGAAIAEPGTALDRLAVRTPAERHLERERDRRSRRAWPEDAVLPELFAEQARRSPDAVAAADSTTELTYGRLLERVEELAAHLRRQGVRPGRTVGVLVDRSVDMLAALLGVLAAGGAYVPLDPGYPEDRLRYMAEDAGLHLLLTGPGTPPSLGVPVLRLDQVPEEASALPGGGAVRSRGPAPDDPAYVIYTSGSTGRPKGVQVPHRALANLLLSMAEEPGLSAGDHLLALTTVCFDIAALELFLPLITGARVEILPAEVTRDGVLLRRLLENSPATVMQATPATWKMLLAAGWRGTPGLKALCGGEALEQDTAERLLARAGEVWNMFGPTETTIWSSVSRLTPGEGVTIGHPIANTTLHVLDARRRPVPTGVPGELYIGGAGLAIGYLGRPELTEERFVTLDGERRYRTGDLVRALPDGRIEYLGRLDTQVKVRGFRIEPGEVEAVLRARPGVREAAVVSRPVGGDNALYAFVVPAEGARPPAREDLGTWLPAYLVPDVLVSVPALPYTLNGKVDRAALRDAPLEELRASQQPGRSATPDRHAPAGAAAPAIRAQDLARLVAEILDVDAAGLPYDVSLGELGMNSVSFTALSTRITEHHGIEVLPTLFYRCPTIEAVVAHLARKDQQNDGTAPDAPDHPETAVPVDGPNAPDPAAAAEASAGQLPASRRSDLPDGTAGDIAIVGMAARLPGSADLSEFWDHLVQGHDLIREIPADRWDWRAHTDVSRSRWGGFVEGVDRFDAAFFGISPREAELMDPQQRLLLEVVWSAIEDAGYRASDLRGRRVGVFIGTTNSDYAQLQRSTGHAAEAHSLTGAAQSVIPNRISYVLDLRGPSLAVDTACSSSLTAVHQAVTALRDGSCDLAIAGGASLILDPGLYAALSRGEMLSEDGRCKAFDASANGYVRGEGVGVVVLRDLAAARRDGDRVAAVVKATAVNHGGRTTSLTAPSPDAQADLLERAYRAAGVDPDSVGYIEAHGTGTELGDPIEVTGLTEAFTRLDRTARPDGPVCGIGSVKTNIGHLEAAAGIAGLLKVVLALRHRTLPASLHFRERNPYVRLDDGPFEVVDTTRPWPSPVDAEGRPLPRRAGVSSFGFGGAGAHVVLEEAPDTPGAGSESEPEHEDLYVLSARTTRALREQARRLAAFVRRERPALADIAHTLRVGRESMPERLAFVARDRVELLRLLDTCAEGRTEPDVLRGDARTGRRRTSAASGAAWRDFVRALAADRDLRSVAELWTDGADVDWSDLPPARRIGLPTYPFEPVRHWLDTSAGTGTEQAGDGDGGLLDENVSTFGTTAFVKRLTGTEFYLADHRVGDDLVLPGVLYLELARQAGERAHGRARVRHVEDVVWAAPLTLPPGRNQELRVTVAPSGEFEISSEHPHAHGRLVLDDRRPTGADVPGPVDVAALRERCRDSRTPEECYARFSGVGFHYGPAFRVLQELRLGDGEALAVLRHPGLGPRFAFHPSLLDGALQAAGWLAEGTAAHLPYAIGAVRLFAPEPAAGWPQTCLVHAVAVERGPDGQAFDITLAAEDGTPLARIERFVLRPVPGAGRRTHAFEPVWEEAADTPAAVHAEVHRLVILDTGDERAETLRAELSALAPEWDIRTGDPDGASHLVHLASGSDLDEALRSGFHRALTLCRTRIAGRGGPLRYLYVHDDEPGAAGAAHAALDAFARSIGQEHPQIRMSVVARTGASGSPRDLAELVRAEVLCGAGPELRTDGRRRLSRAWRPLALPAPAVSPLARDGAHLITGGSGRLALHVARRIADRHPGAGIVLVSRSAPAGPLPDGWLHVRADVTVPADVARAVRAARDRFGRVAGVVHAAGTLRDALVLHKSDADAEAVLAPKVLGAVLLDEATRADEPDYFVVFGSTAAVFGNAGQTDYAFANSFLDHYLQRRPGRGLAVDWSLWQDGGMTLGAEARRAMRREFGMEPLPTEAALDALEAALAHGATRVLLTAGDATRIGAALLRADAPQAAPPAAAPAPAEPAEPAGDLRAGAVEFLRGLLAQELKTAVEDIAEDEPFDHYGVDSLLVLSLTRALEKHFGPLSKTLFFEYVTTRELAGYLAEEHPAALRELLGTGPVSEPVPATPSEPPRTAGRTLPAETAARPVAVHTAIPADDRDDIVIVGVAGRYPKADDLWEFWRNLRQGRDCVEEVPRERWNHDQFYDPDADAPGKTYGKWGGWLSDVGSFDPMFFRMSKAEADHIDPQERLFLQTVWHLLEDAGTSRAALSSVRTGVFVGLMYGHYQLYGVEEALRGTGAATSSSYASVANRVSYFYGFDGPSIAIDTMCSSSLTALHLACQAIRDGDCDVAVAGGVNVSSHPLKYLQLAKGGFLSTDGRCRSFGEGGDGYVPAEGVGALLLKRRSAAEADGDRILAVVRASAVNHGGAGKGYSVPNPRAQAVVIGDALGRAGLTPAELDYLEAHGTGTSLGDPVEIAGLARAFKGHELRGVRIPIGSVKSVIGHAEAAAGMAALTKVLLQLRHGELAPSLHAERLNPELGLDTTPFHVQRRLAPWTPRADAAGRPLPRTAAVSAFGAGGSNAHVILEEYVPTEQADHDEAPYVCVLSARDADRLTEYAERIAGFLRAEGRDTPPGRLARTLQSREPMAHRLAVVFDTVTGLVKALDAHLSGAGSPHVLTGVAERAAQPPADRTPHELAAAWVRGADVRWPRVGQPVALPGYPFARERCWVPAAAVRDTTGDSVAVRQETAAVPGPPEHDLVREVVLSADTPVIAGHRVQGRALLPALAYCDLLAQVFAEHGLPVERLTLRDLTVVQPLDATDAPVTARIHCAVAGPGRWRVTVTDGDGTVRATAEAVAGDPPPFTDRLTPRPHGTPRPLSEVYARDEANGQVYAGAARAEGSLWHDAGDLVADLVAPRGEEHLAHPALLLGAAVAAGALLDTEGRAYLPLHVASFRTAGPLTGRRTVRVRRDAVERRGEIVRMSLDFFDEEGRQVAELSGLSSKAVQSTPPAPAGAADRWSAQGADGDGTQPSDAVGAAEDLVRRLLAGALGREPQAIPVTAGYYELGLESVQVLALVEDLQKALGRELPPTLLFEFPTVHDLAVHLAHTYPGALPPGGQGRAGTDAPTAAPAAAPAPTGLSPLRAAVTVPPAPAPGPLRAEELDRLVAGQVLARLHAAGAFGDGPATTLDRLADRLCVQDAYRRWLEEAVRLLTATGLLRERPDGTLEPVAYAAHDDSGWRAVRDRCAADPYWNAQLSLVEECVDRLPEILSGALAATDVLFPGGSMAKLTAVYQGNPVADRLNDVVAEVTAAAVRQRRTAEPTASVHVAEVGAGTGGTTAVVLPRLDADAGHLAYWYTDLSPAFLDQAERRFGAGRPYLRYGRWDVEQPGAGERVTGGGLDVIVATNVLHATRDIRRVLRNLAAALRPGGLLVVNEITRKSAVLTLTFGLLEGWWRYDDTEVRTPGAPILTGARWQEALRDAGFADIWRPVAEPDAFGEVFVAQRPDEFVPPPGTRLLGRTWEPAGTTPGRAPAAVAVLGPEDAAQRLAANLPDAVAVASAAELDDRFDALVDLGGTDLADWLPALQRMAGRGALLLGVGPGDARAGLYRMLGHEYRRLRSRYLEADPADPGLPELVGRELADAGDEVEVSYRDGVRHRAALAELPAGTGGPVRFPADEVLLITGGTRGIGLALARHAVDRWGARTVVLTGREQLPPREEWDRHGDDSPLGRKLSGLRALERELDAKGARLRVLSLPLGEDAGAVGATLAQLRRDFGPIGGVLHAAGLVDRDNLAFVSKPVHAVRAVLAPKTAGVDALVDAVADDPLRFFVLFSSVASLVPAAAVGQSDYAMANAHLDAVARRRPHGLPLVSVAWPSWRGVGMGTERPGPGYQATGLGELSLEQGLRILDHILATGAGPVVLPAVVEAGWSPRRLAGPASDGAGPGGPPAARPASPATSQNLPASLTGDLATARAAAASWILDQLAELVGYDRDRLAADVPIADYGTDSIMTVQVLRRVGDRLGAELAPDALVEQPTVDSFTAWLATRHGPALTAAFGSAAGEPSASGPGHTVAADAAGGAVRALAAVREPSGADEPHQAAGDIAVIGMSGRFPGAADLDGYWRLLDEGRSALGPVPPGRWRDGEGLMAGLLDLDGFDPARFHLSDTDAAAMDPQALLLLEETLFALCDAGYRPEEVKGRDIGVYVGGRSRHNPSRTVLDRSRNPVVAIGQNYLAANLSHHFDLRGPGVVVDTACSSALVALQQAVQAMRAGDIEGAVVAGVGLLPDAGGHRLFGRRGLLNTEAEFHVFDRRARGLTPAEGVGVLLLRPLDAARAAGDRVHAVIKAVAVNNDGRTAGPATPNPAAQRAVMLRALSRAGVRPEDVTHIETNAAGSAVPDLIELKAIADVYRPAGTTPCYLGSVKPNIGHPQCAEGMAGLIKTVLMLRNRRITPFRSGEQPPEHFDFDAVPLRFTRVPLPWPDGAPLVAAVSSFADGGTNAHAVLAGYDGPAGRPPVERPRLTRRRLPAAHVERFAVVGMAGHYPGAADLAAFWENLKAGRDAVREVPAERWAEPDGTGTSRWGGFLDEVDRFDAAFFRVPPQEAEITDPQERWFLRTCWEAIEDAGYTPATLAAAKGPHRRRAVGVFAGAMHKDYTLIGAEASVPVPLSLNQGQIANRVSFVCDFHGPSLTVDTLCSSSLTAVHLAVQSLRRGECDVAIAGGVNLSLHPGKYRTYGMVGMHSSDGRCRSFGQGGDGYVSAEGVGAVVLKPLADAEADGDHIYAVISGSAVNHVGAVSGFSVPSPVGQADVISAALAEAGVDARSIGYVEAHGTGTALGDPVEVRGLVTAFQRDTQDTGFCALGSVKSNIGHAESAAGIAGLSKVALQLHHRVLVPSLHAETPNRLLDLDSTPFRLQRETADWPAPAEGPRRAGLSSFGATGAGAHLVLEEYVPAEQPSARPASPGQPVLVPLSARSEDRLREMAARLRDALAAPGAPSPADTAHTLQVGRTEFPVRVAFVEHDTGRLLDRLDDFARHGIRPELSGTPLHDTARRWAEGDRVDWPAPHGTARPRRVSLPAYPFAGERYWVPAHDPGRATRSGTDLAAVTPGLEERRPAAPVAAPDPVVAAPAGKEDPRPSAPAAVVPVPPSGLLTVPHWTQAPAAPSAPATPGRVLILADEAGTPLADALAAHYRQAGTDVTGRPLDGPYDVAGARPDRVHVVIGPDRAGPGTGGEAERAVLRLVRALAHAAPDVRTDLFLVTHDTQSVAGEPSGTRGAGLAGLAYFLARDGRRFAVRNLDVSAADLTGPEARAALAAAVAAEQPAADGELVALRGGRRYRQQVRPVASAEAADPALAGIRPGGHYVVVGGTGFVGRTVGRHLVDRYDAKVVFVGRRAEDDPEVRAALADGRIGYVRGDVTDARQAREALDAARGLLGDIHGVVFAGATRITGALVGVADLAEEEFRAHFDVKAAGARHVYEAVVDQPLDFLCYFSSAQAFAFGGAGTHPAYAAGITFADAFTRAVGRTAAFPVGVVNWGAWRSSFGDAARNFPMLGFLEDDEGAACFDTAVRLLRAGRHHQVIALRVPADRTGHTDGRTEADGRPDAGRAADALRPVPAAVDRRPEIERLLVERLARTLRVPTGELSPSVAFADLGVDSITGAAFVTEIAQELGVDVNAGALYEFPSVARLSGHLAELAAAREPDVPARDRAPAGAAHGTPPAADGAPVPEDLIATLEARFAAGELSATEVLDLLDAELATEERR